MNLLFFLQFIFYQTDIEKLGMIAYEFYWVNPVKGYKLLGVLPEKRKNSERITKKSVMNWTDKVLGNNLSTKDICFVKVKINKYTGKLFRAPFFVTQQNVEK